MKAYAGIPTEYSKQKQENSNMNIVVLCGGISTERNVSLVSGSKIYQALKGRGHRVVLLDIYLGYKGDIEGIFESDRDWAAGIGSVDSAVPDLDAVRAQRGDDADTLFGPHVIDICRRADIVFMGLHGDCGENGKVQATFDLFGIKYTGTDYLSSALSMDKWVTKQLFMQNGVSTPKAAIVESLDDGYLPEFPAVVKVCNGGSSIGVYIVNDETEYRKALTEAFTLESRVLVEQYIRGRELTDGVFDGKALPVVEIAPREGFYDYKNKYQAGATVETCPADLPEDVTHRVQKLAEKAYRVLRIKTYARIDIMMDEHGELYCLEANTLPGMTPTSLIPQEAAAVGVDFAGLCEKIIEVSLAKYE